jgi:glycosyltransferase involved in cell wall biosynthesis
VTDLLERLGLHGKRFVVYPANDWPHKNHKRLLAAMARHREALKDRGLDLVLTGSFTRRADELRREAHRLGVGDQVHFLGFVDDRRLAAIWRGCRGLVLPSLYEGFGMPVLEAMWFGKPVAASTAGSLPEVGGDAAIYFDAEDVDAIAAALERLAVDEELVARLSQAGAARASRFDPDAMVHRYLDVLDRTVTEARSPGPVVRVTGDHGATRRPPRRPFLSVVTPSFQQGEFLEETIQSVLGQSFGDFEYVVCDGGSDDGTIEVLRRHEDRVRWVSEPDRGQADAVHKGISMTSGEVIAWINSDDVYLPGAFELVAEVFRRQPELSVAYFAADYIDENGAVLEPCLTEPWNPQRLFDVCFVTQPAAFFRRELYERAGGLDRDLHYCLDYELWLRLAAYGPFLYVPIKVACSRLYPWNKTRARAVEHATEINDVLRRFGPVPATWMFHYAHVRAYACGYDRTDPEQDRRFIRELTGELLRASLRWRTPPSRAAMTIIARWLLGDRGSARAKRLLGLRASASEAVRQSGVGRAFLGARRHFSSADSGPSASS